MSRNTLFDCQERSRHSNHLAMKELIRMFKTHFKDRAYIDVPSIDLTSRADPTVHLIGSHISVLKPYVLNQKIPDQGFCISQKCVRTRPMDSYFDRNKISYWHSFFYSLGALVPAPSTLKLCKDLQSFLTRGLLLTSEDYKIRVSSRDRDLLEYCNNCGFSESLEIDTKPEGYYRHTFGLDGFSGRNFNIAIKDKNSSDYLDIGNVVTIENNGKHVATELGLGTTVILKPLLGLDLPIDSFDIELPGTIEYNLRRKMEDSILTSSMLIGEEGIKTYKRARQILGYYLKSLAYFRKASGLSMSDLEQTLQRFEKTEFSEGSFSASNQILNLVSKFDANDKLTRDFYKKFNY